MKQEGENFYLNPEGLTKNQEILAGMLFDSQIRTPITRRKKTREGYEFYKVIKKTSPFSVTTDDEEFVLKLHEQNPEAQLSPFYISLRNLPDDVLHQVGKVFAEIPGRRPDFCAGIPNAGVPLADAYAKLTAIPHLPIFEKEEQGFQRKIVARSIDVPYSFKLRILDDLATGGETKLESLNAARGMGFSDIDIAVIIDRQQGAKDLIEQAGYAFHAAYTVKQLLQFGRRTERISEKKYEEIISYLQQN